MSENVCCPQLEVVPCADTSEHKHLVCMSWQTEGDATLDNEYATHHCLGSDGTYTSCPFYPKVG